MKRILAISIITCLSGGCILYPDPHTTERFHPVQGHVVDASTGKPIAGASVAIHGHSYHNATTDKNG